MKNAYQRISRFLIGGVFAVVIFVCSIFPASALPPISPEAAIGLASLAFQCFQYAQQNVNNASKFDAYISQAQQLWIDPNSSYYSFQEVDPDDLWTAMSDLIGTGYACHYAQIYISINGVSTLVYVVVGDLDLYIAGASSSNTHYIYTNGRYFSNTTRRVLYATHYPSSYVLSSIQLRFTSFFNNIVSCVDGIESALSSINTKLDSILSAITGSSSVVAKAHSQIEQMALITSNATSAITSGSDYNFLINCFNTGTTDRPYSRRVYVSYEALSNLATELLDAGFNVSVSQIAGYAGYYIRDQLTFVVNPTTHAQVWNPNTAGVGGGAFTLANGLYVCALYDSGSLLNDLNLRVVTVWNSIENGFSSLDNSISSVGDDVSAILDYLNSYQSHDTTLYVKNVYSAGSSYRIIPYESMMQMLADINVNYLDYPCYILDVGEGFLSSSASMSSSFNIAENDYYSLIVRYREVGSGNEQIGRLCDATGAMFRAYQKDNYPFRILESVRSIRDWLENADLENNTTVNNVVNNYVDQVNVSIDSFSRILDLFITASDFGDITADWGGAADYFINLGKDPVVDGGDGS